MTTTDTETEAQAGTLYGSRKAQEGAHEVAEPSETEGGAEVTVEEMATDLVAELGDEITPYKIHAVINALLEAFEVEYRVRPQMMYNYDRNGMIVKGKANAKRYTADEAIAFAVRFVNKRLAAS